MQVIIRRTGKISDGARALRDAIRKAGYSAKVTTGDLAGRNSPSLIINWAARNAIVSAAGDVVLNSPDSIGVAQCKRATFNKLRENQFDHIPDFWTHPPTDEQRGKDIIVERVTTTGEGGAGINIKRVGEALTPNLPLYVRYIRKDIELRVHVIKGEAVAVQQKRKKADAVQDDNQQLIRNYDNGWIFATNDVDQKAALAAKPVAVEAMRILGLDFGALDMVIRKKDGKAFVLEVNTKPGIESETVIKAYTDKVTQMIPAGAVKRVPRVVKKKPVKKVAMKKKAAPYRDAQGRPAKASNEKIAWKGGTYKWISTKKGARVWRQVA